MTENNNQQQLMMNEVGLLNVRINDMMSQLNKTVNMLLDVNQKLMVELQQLKGASDVKTEKVNP